MGGLTASLPEKKDSQKQGQVQQYSKSGYITVRLLCEGGERSAQAMLGVEHNAPPTRDGKRERQPHLVAVRGPHLRLLTIEGVAAMSIATEYRGMELRRCDRTLFNMGGARDSRHNEHNKHNKSEGGRNSPTQTLLIRVWSL